jgi:tetratricopeptide (TPR) repeat protein
MTLSCIWFVVVPRWSMTLARGDRDRRERILRWVVNTPAPSALNALSRFLLGANTQVGGRYDEAEAIFRSILRDNGKRLDPGFESVVRQHLADTIDALGRSEEATAERERAAAVLVGAEDTFLGLQARGQLLDRQRRYDEAVAAYQRALALSPTWERDLRAQLMMRLVLSTFNAGRPADTLRWAEAVLVFDPDGPMNPMARRMAALACSNLGRLDEAERHLLVGLERSGDPTHRVESLALLGGYLFRRGDLDGAERTAREAEAILPDRRRTTWTVIAEVERARGHLEAAVRALEHAKTISMGHIPAANRKVDAAIDKSLAIIHAELGHHEVARDLIAGAEAELADDPKQGVIFNASAALVEALAGDRDRALARIESAERGRRAVPQDGRTQVSVLSLLGRAALAVDEPGRAEVFVRELLDLGPDPVYLPFAWFHLGECRRRLDDESGGVECDAKAASTRFGTRWERLARERLEAEAGSSASSSPHHR